MLEKILSKETCKQCQFCCSFRRQSLWELPLLTREQKNNLEKKFQNISFIETQKEVFTPNLKPLYKTNNEEEEVKCFFLDYKKGCSLDATEKPFDCKIWPLRLMKKNNHLVIALTPTCPAINKIAIEELKTFTKENLSETLFDYARKNPFIIKAYKENFPILVEQQDCSV